MDGPAAAATAAVAPEVPHELVQREMFRFVRPSLARGLGLFLADYAVYLLALAGVLYLPALWMKVLASLVAGFKIGNLVIIGHDAAHNALTPSLKLNRVLATLAFLPELFNHELWVYDHHVLHHARTNEQHPDSYTPLSKADYDALTPWQRFRYRLYRTPSVFVFGLYYIFERWWEAKLYPRARMPRAIHARAWGHFALLVAYLGTFLTVLWHAPAYSPTGPWTAVLLGFLLPWYVFQSLFAFTVYVQHTHPRVAWFRNVPQRDQGDARQEYISVHLEFPRWFSWLAHNIYDHAAHHVCTLIPCYRLAEAQQRLNGLIGPRAVRQRFSFRWLYDNMRRCRLYDYERHQWLDYDGTPTSGPARMSEQVPPSAARRTRPAATAAA